MILLQDRKILGIKGQNVKSFLNGMLTQRTEDMAVNQAKFAALLTGQGRLIADVILYLKAEDFMLIDCHKNQLMTIAQTLHKYNLEKDMEFHDLSDEYSVYSSFDTEIKTTQIHFIDPRHKGLGLRIFSQEKLTETATELDYLNKRLELCIPESFYDAEAEKTLPNELCFEELNAIDFKKGCYIGQELTARTKFRTLPKKRLMKVVFLEETSVTIPTLILSAEGKEAGICYSQHNNLGLGLLRLTEVQKNQPLYCNGIQVMLQKPDWANYDL